MPRESMSIGCSRGSSLGSCKTASEISTGTRDCVAETHGPAMLEEDQGDRRVVRDFFDDIPHVFMVEDLQTVSRCLLLSSPSTRAAPCCPVRIAPSG